MYDKAKAFLNNTVAWFLLMAAAVFYFWKKEKDIENELQESKANEKLKGDKDAVKEADSAAALSDADYDSVRRKYLDEHPDER